MARCFGQVRVTSADVRDKPAIDNAYLTSAEDRLVAAKGLRLTREIMCEFAGANQEVLPGPELTTDEELAKAAEQVGTSIFHPVGTCAMGDVVDSSLGVNGVQGLKVCDASVMPRITSGNTNTPTMAIAEILAGMLEEEWRHNRTKT
ncbi:hypothetical protein TeGR_g5852 [Tetraparma gracilis]|jgi:choline dehydrogenase|uniref:Glucose-methanol-choline oxidoreductase C-terminal domain-containing protein n=1 Tax=Tetraparma gracilis TaxID=2962635 RepID=A0ABQ6MM20_9STRA|nr:hypothetical protein TeGR_g5852 [Tetraparma gracilis]